MYVFLFFRQKSSRKRSVSKDNTPQDVSVNAKFDTLSSNSDKVTLQNLNTILKQLPDANLQLVGVSSTDSSNASNQSGKYLRVLFFVVELNLITGCVVVLFRVGQWLSKKICNCFGAEFTRYDNCSWRCADCVRTLET